MSRSIRVIATGVAAAGVSAAALGQTITDLGFLPGGQNATPVAISADGRTVIGSADHQGSPHAFKWTAAGIVDLGALPGHLDSAATAVNADGSTIVGQSGFAITKWTSAGIQVLVPWTSGQDQYAFLASGITADASLITGNQTCAGVPAGDSSCNIYGYAFRADAAGTRTPLVTVLPSPFRSMETLRANAISAEGAIVVGSCAAFSEDTDGFRAFRWTAATGMQNLGIVPGFQPAGQAQSYSHALAISGDGSTIVGDCQGQPTSGGAGGGNFSKRAFRWTAATGMQDLGILPGTFTTVSANAVSRDGSVIVGKIANFEISNQHALLWTPGRGWVDLNTYLPTIGISVTGWSLESAVAVSADGRTIAGTGRHSGSFSHAWVVTLPPPPQPTCGSADFNGDGDTGTDADIEAFFACLAGNCCATCDPHGSDFNGDGDAGTDADIEAFFRVLAGGSC